MPGADAADAATVRESGSPAPAPVDGVGVVGEREGRRRAVLRVLDAVAEGRLDGAPGVFEEVFGEEARHHRAGPPLPDGPTGARALYCELRERLPGAVATVKRTVVDGDIAGVHWHASGDPLDEFSGESWCEFFRFDGERVAEHWQLHVRVPTSTVSGRSVFSDAYSRRDGGAPGDDAVENRRIASGAFARFTAFDQTVVEDFWGAVYLQHNETIPDGTAALRQSLEEVGGLAEEVRPAFDVVLVAAEADLVWFLERVRVGRETGWGADIFRLDAGRFVEHWDVPALRPPAGTV